MKELLIGILQSSDGTIFAWLIVGQFILSIISLPIICKKL